MYMPVPFVCFVFCVNLSCVHNLDFYDNKLKGDLHMIFFLSVSTHM